MHQSLNTSNTKKTATQRDPRNINWKSEKTPEMTFASHDPSMQHTVASHRHQQALFFFQRKNNREAIKNCPSSRKYNHKPKVATHHDHGRSDVDDGKRCRKTITKKEILHAVTEADIVSNRVKVTSLQPCLLCSHSTQHALQTTQLWESRCNGQPTTSTTRTATTA